MIKIIVDCFGGDLSPQANVEGAIQAINQEKNLQVILVGKQDLIEEELKKYQYDASQVEILDAKDVISCDDKPTDAIKHMNESSMVKAFDLLKSSEEYGGMVTSGSTGAVLAGAVLKIGRIRGVKRPAFCPVFPTLVGTVVGVCDSGANVDCDPLYLKQFAQMGSLYLKMAYDIENPRVALLNIGTEEEKGDMRTKEAYQLIKNETEVNFVGNMESRDLLTGKYDLVVADGFSGNVLIKTTEGTAMELLKLLKKTFTKNLKNKIGAALLKKDVYGLKNLLDYNNYPGAVLVGCSKVIVKGHGSSKSSAIMHSVLKAYKLVESDYVKVLGDEIAKTM